MRGPAMFAQVLPRTLLFGTIKRLVTTWKPGWMLLVTTVLGNNRMEADGPHHHQGILSPHLGLGALVARGGGWRDTLALDVAEGWRAPA